MLKKTVTVAVVHTWAIVPPRQALTWSTEDEKMERKIRKSWRNLLMGDLHNTEKMWNDRSLWRSCHAPNVLEHVDGHKL